LCKNKEKKEKKMSPEQIAPFLLIIYIAGSWILVDSYNSSELLTKTHTFWISLRYSLTLSFLTLLCLGMYWSSLLFFAMLCWVYRKQEEEQQVNDDSDWEKT
jgi:hypothetical protein